MAELVYLKGDATNPSMAIGEQAFIPHICNNVGGWGAGFVLALSKKWEEPEIQYRQWMKRSGRMPNLGDVQYCSVADEGKYKNTRVVNMIAQNGFRSEDNPKPIKYAALVDAMRQVAGYMNSIDGSIHCPKFGAGLAGGDWRVIEALIQEIWVDAGINVTVYEWEG